VLLPEHLLEDFEKSGVEFFAQPVFPVVGILLSAGFDESYPGEILQTRFRLAEVLLDAFLGELPEIPPQDRLLRKPWRMLRGEVVAEREQCEIAQERILSRVQQRPQIPHLFLKAHLFPFKLQAGR